MSTAAAEPTAPPAGRRPLHWAPIAAAVLVVLALLLAIPMAPPPADAPPRPAASVGAEVPAVVAGATP